MNPDKKVLKLMNSLGSNTSKSRPIYLYFFFPTEEAANLFAQKLKGMSFDVQVSLSGVGRDWLCLANCDTFPDSELLDGLRKLLSPLAEKLDGTYDGWETEMIF